MSQYQEQLEKEIQAHNELHNNIQAGEEQLAAMKQERDRRIGRIQLLQELAQQNGQNAPAPQPTPVPDGQPEAVEG